MDCGICGEIWVCWVGGDWCFGDGDRRGDGDVLWGENKVLCGGFEC